ncbi:anti-sigma-K factor rskA family protein [Collimonas arenae]|uniref:Anti-sigma-K factor rskA family protein n=1 Tax=Collimonas arenae TaxID=279058 RepID=A0A127PM99_9BURK|nr:anti-sigma factor [Collimonas arenae]AMO98561.1 anti-sigma-K factor rskA family protein [Collimonas arenae]AMP08448.1 anti-sigma-K factor rskA family protein [Collimonas arenae]
MDIHLNTALVDKLAAEYVLGTLRGGARRRFESLLRQQAVLRKAVAEWQDRLQPMAELAPAAEPSASVWPAIETRLGLKTKPQRKQSFWLELREDLSFWRGLGLVSTTAALILTSLLLTKQLEPVAPVTSYVAMLSNEQAQPIAVVTGDVQGGHLVVKVVAPQAIAADKSLELWAVPKEGHPRSLGLLAANGSATLALPAGTTPQTVPLLAVTLEPKGGSPKADGPTGPVVFKGAWVQI